MNKKQTAVEQYIERLQNLHKTLPINNAHNRAVKGIYVHAIMIAKEYIEKEREQIEEAYQTGGRNALTYPLDYPRHLTKEDYYT